MTLILILLALSTLSGFILGRNDFRWHAVLAAAMVLAPLSAVILQNRGFGALSGISAIAACLTVNQVAYLIGAFHANRSPRNGDVPRKGPVEKLPQQRADDVPRDGRGDDVRHEQKREQNMQFKLAQPTIQRQADLAP
jgi:hypothetical protein